MAPNRGGNGGSGSNGGNGSNGNSNGNGGGQGNPQKTPLEKFDEVVEGGYNSGPSDMGQTQPTEGYYRHTESSDNGILGVEGYSAGPVNVEQRVAAYAEDGTAYFGGTVEGSVGPVSASRSFYARADARVNNEGVHVGADAEYREEISAGPVSLSGTARAGAGVNINGEKAQLGADASVSADATVGGGGNEISGGVGVGFGGGVEVIYNEDSDGDGRGEVGFGIGLKGGYGGNVGIRFEPKTVAEEVQSWFTGDQAPKDSGEKPHPFPCCDRFEAALEMPESQAAYARLQSLL